MNARGSTTELLVVDVAAVPGRPDRLAVVEVLAGRPEPGMVFHAEHAEGSWRVTEEALFQPERGAPTRRRPLGFQSLNPGRELSPGLHLIENHGTPHGDAASEIATAEMAVKGGRS